MPTDRQAPSGYDLVRKWRDWLRNSPEYRKIHHQDIAECATELEAFLARLAKLRDSCASNRKLSIERANDNVGSREARWRGKAQILAEVEEGLATLLGTPGEAPGERSKT